MEQDLLLSRLLIDIFSHPELRSKVAFRGGTALNKLIFRPASRYSEDIDLVQLQAGGIGAILNPMQALLRPLLGEADVRLRRHSSRLVYRWTAENDIPMGVKIEINTREHTSYRPLVRRPFKVENPWVPLPAVADLVTYDTGELLGTKLRALFQRKKGRDLYDLGVALERGVAPPPMIVDAFQFYMEREGHRVSRAEFEKNVAEKMRDKEFVEDTAPFLTTDVRLDLVQAHAKVVAELLALLPGEPWRGDQRGGESFRT